MGDTDLTSNRGTTRGARKAITLQNQASSPLLRLPAETRNQIYGYVLSDDKITVCGQDCCDHRGEAIVQGSPVHAHFPIRLLRVLEVCQQVHAEARLLVFSLNILSGHTLDSVYSFLTGAGLKPSQVAAITTLEFSVTVLVHCHLKNCSESMSACYLRNLKLLEGLPSVEKVVVWFLKFKKPHWGHDTCEAKAKRDTERVIKQQGRGVQIEIHDIFY